MHCDIRGNKNLELLLKNHQNEKKTTIVLKGSTRSGKTFDVMSFLCFRAATVKGYIGRCFRRDATVAKRTLKPDLFQVLANYYPGLWDRKNWNEQNACYTFPHTGGKLYLAGSSEPETLRGQKQTDAFLNECTEQSLEAKRQIEMRTEGYKIYDFNPSTLEAWIYTDVLKQSPEKYLYIHSTYKDNRFLSPEIIRSIEKWEPTPENINEGTASEWHWSIFGLGIEASKPGCVYTNWSETTDWPSKMACTRHGYFLDFGFSIDPTALGEAAFFQDTLYLRELVYETGLINLVRVTNPEVPSLEGRLKDLGITRDDFITADAAHPDLINELNIANFHVYGVPKTKNVGAEGWVLTGIKKTQAQKIKVFRSSINLIKEFNNYTWKRDPRTDIQLNKPIGDFNHLLDGVRTWVMHNLTPRRIDNRQGIRSSSKYGSKFDNLISSDQAVNTGNPYQGVY